MIQAVLFDLDGTLLDRVSTLSLFLDQQFDRFAPELPGIEREVYIETVAGLDQFGYVPRPEVYAEAQRLFQLSPELSQGLLRDFELHFHPLAIPFPGMREMLTDLAALPVKLGLVTNGLIKSQRPKIEALAIADFFQSILVSEEQGVRKPEPEIYQRAMRQLGSVPATTVFVGDHPEADIAGAARVGLKTIWKQNTCWPPPEKVDATINELAEILPIVARW